MANSSENRSYDEQWQKAFESAEMPPSPKVWKHIDQQLAAQEGGKYKRGFFFYRAAAAVLLLGIAGLTWYTLTRSDTPGTVANQIEVNYSQSGQQPSDSADVGTTPPLSEGTDTTAQSGTTISGGNNQQRKDNSSVESLIAKGSSDDSNASSEAASGSSENTAPEKNEAAVALNESANLDQENEAAPASTFTEPFTAKALIFPNEEVSSREEELLSNHPVGRLSALPPGGLVLTAPTWAESIDKLFLVPQYRDESTSEAKKRGAQFFAGLAMAPSYFDPNLQAQPVGRFSSDFALGAESLSPPNFDTQAENLFVARQDNSNANASSVVEEGLQNRSSLSFSYGFNVGLELGEHWSIESGLDFQNFQTTTETRYTVLDLQSGARYPLVATNARVNAANSLNTTPIGTPREVDNQFQFVSVPVLIGYNVRFSKVTLMVSPGIAANLFLSNRISSEQYASSTISTNGNSPFNKQYFSGMISGGVFYQLVENYSLSLTPSYQFALTDLASRGAGFSSQPESFGLRLGFRYNFQ